MRLPVLLLAAVTLLSGCALQRESQARAMAGLQDTELRSRARASLAAFDDVFEAHVDGAATEIERRSANREHRRAAALWRTRMVPACHELTRQEFSPEVLIDLWLLCRQMLDFLASDHGLTLFGPHQPIALAASQSILEAFEEIPRELTTPEAFAELRSQVQASAQAYPLSADFMPAAKRAWQDLALVGTARRIASLPLTPLNALGGIGRAPDSVREVSASVDRFSAVAEDLPTNARWQLKLLATDLAETETVTATLDSLARFAASSEEFNRTLAAYPAEIARQTQIVLDDAVTVLPGVEATLSEARETVALVQTLNKGFRGTLADSEQLVEQTRETLLALTEAAGAVRLTTQEALKFVPASQKDENGQLIGKRPAGASPDAEAGSTTMTVNAEDRAFSFQAVTESAVALQGAAREVLAVLAEVRQLSAQHDAIGAQLDRAGARVDASVATAATRIEKVINYAWWRALQLLLAALALLLAYRLLTARLGVPAKTQARRPAPGQPPPEGIGAATGARPESE
jgi:hypothetical protein